MIAAVALIEAGVAIEIIDAIAIAIKSIQTITSISKMGNLEVVQAQLEFEESFRLGNFRKKITYDGHEISDQEFQLLLGERVVMIERYCQSTTKYIPSGLMTVFTWTFSGQAMRHEFILLTTENHFGIMELVKQKVNNIEIQMLNINMWRIESTQQSNQIRNYILKDRHYDRSLKRLVYSDIGDLQFQQINQFVNVMLVSWETMSKNENWFSKLDICHKFSKQFARSVLYFCEAQPDYDIVLQSVFGCFTDKPMFLPHIDIILVEKSMWHGQKLSDERKQNLLNLVTLLTELRTSFRLSVTQQ